MPVVLDRLPLPNLRWYSICSVILLSCSIYYAVMQVSINPNWKDRLVHSNEKDLCDKKSVFEPVSHLERLNLKELHNSQTCPIDGLRDKYFNKSTLKLIFSKCSTSKVRMPGKIKEFSLTSKEFQTISPHMIPDVIRFMLHEPLCIWTLINMAYCILIVLGTAIQHLVFGELRVSEQQHIKDKFWNFVFYKFIFVFGVMNVQAMGEVILWCSWFSILGFLHLLAQLCKDRFEYLSFSPTTPKRTHLRVLGLLGIILFLASSCLLISVAVGFHTSINTFAFMAAECVLLMVRTLYVISRYSIYLWDISHEGLWEKRGLYVYYTELVFELSELVIDMIHHIHMLVWGNMFLTMASLVICMQLRLLFYQLQHKVKSHKTYLRVVRLIERYPQVERGEISYDEDTCAICWEVVEIGRRLDCSHLFHSSCLTAWLHHDLSCPTCRHKLNPYEESTSKPSSLFSTLMPSGMDNEESDSVENQGATSGFPSPVTPEGMPGHSGWRYVSWLSLFSVEQNHTQLPPHHHQPNSQLANSSQLDNLARQVQQMFPDLSYECIHEDLQRTHSLEDTVDNILEQRLVMPPPPMFTQGSDRLIGSTPGRRPEDFFPFELTKYGVEEVEKVAKVPLAESSHSHTHNSSEMTQDDDALVVEGILSIDSDSDSNDIEHCLELNSMMGCRFSKSPQEREEMLAQRKDALLSLARQRFSLKSSSHSEDEAPFRSFSRTEQHRGKECQDISFEG